MGLKLYALRSSMNLKGLRRSLRTTSRRYVIRLRSEKPGLNNIVVFYNQMHRLLERAGKGSSPSCIAISAPKRTLINAEEIAVIH